MNIEEIKALHEAHRDEIIAQLKDSYAKALRVPTCEYRVYIDSDGRVGDEEWPANDRGWFEFRDPGYYRFGIHTFCAQHYDVLWDYWFSGIGEAYAAFAEHFGFPVNADDDLSDADNMRRTASAHGEIEKYNDWIEAQTEEAIDRLASEVDFELIFEDALSDLDDHPCFV